MEPLHYQPEGDSIVHQITAEVTIEKGSGITFTIKSDDEEIGEIDIEVNSERFGFICGVAGSEEMKNGYLRPASLAVLACLHEDLGDRFDKLVLHDIEDEPLSPNSP